MKILLLCSLFPPDAKGGAEYSAYYSARWLASHGFEVGVLTTAAEPNDQLYGESIDGLKIWRIWYPRAYSTRNHELASSWEKMTWHLQDHYDPRNVSVLQMVLDQFQPEMVHAHLLSGLGHNCLAAINKAGLPVLYFLHDAGLACVRSSMYKRGENCGKVCFLCRLSSKRKLTFLTDSSRYTLVSPSRDNLKMLGSVVPRLSSLANRVIANIDLEEPSVRTHGPDVRVLRLLFVGRLHPTKGIEFILDVLSDIPADECNLSITIVGGGPLEDRLRDLYKHDFRIKILGRVSPEEVNEQMAKTDALLVPSLWRENHPGVIRQAIRAGVPALVSGLGGAPEMIVHQKSGLVIPPGDKAAWRKAILRLAVDRLFLEKLQEGAVEAGRSYSAEKLGNDLVSAIHDATTRARLNSMSPNSDHVVAQS